MRRGLTWLALLGVGLYAAGAYAPLLLYPRFWTSRTMDQDVPWYFMGQALVEGACTLVALALALAVGVVTKRTHGRAVWASLIPAFLFLSMPIGRGLAVLVNSHRLWAGPGFASSTWRTFDQYLYGTSVGGFLALALMSAIVFRFGRAWNDGAAEQRDGADRRRAS